MEIRDLKILCDGDAFESAVITQEDKGYSVTFNVRAEFNTLTPSYSLTRQRCKDEPRVFLTIDAATKAVRSIGFKTLTVNLT